jgi:peptide/nickel transport system substrate-binding protein
MNAIFGYPDPVIGVYRLYLCTTKQVIYTNTSGYCNPKVDEILKKAGVEMDFNKRKALYVEFQKIVTQDLPLVWTHELPYFTIYHKDLRNVPMSIWGSMAPFDKTYWKDGKEPK